MHAPPQALSHEYEFKPRTIELVIPTYQVMDVRRFESQRNTYQVQYFLSSVAETASA